MTNAWTTDQILRPVSEYWGHDALRDLQEPAIRAALAGRDSLVVLPTGGGKSLCYQVPPLLLGRLTVVVSPLISLMKDQVDGLTACGYPAGALNSSIDRDRQQQIEDQLLDGELRLLFVAPERLLTSRMIGLLKRIGVRSFAIDEAHCISHWGHDFRPEYRRLAELREHFPEASLHAFTATATERVRADIVDQLRLLEPEILIGRFDRPNLVYRVQTRTDVRVQTLGAIRRHENRGVIVYCLSRKDTERLADWLEAEGVNARAYHAGMDAGTRKRVQDHFSTERLDVVVATVAFGMGIDRSNVRCVVHATMPKSVEHYQQETGRAGRDGLDAECLLLYSGADAVKWRSLMTQSTEREAIEMGYTGDGTEPGDPRAELPARFAHLRDMESYASAAVCRHRALTEYFGQVYESPGDDACGACDVCLGELAYIDDGTVIAQKILSCVARVDQSFGAVHVADVLVGSRAEKILRFNHDALSTYGLLKGTPRQTVMRYIDQLIALGLLARVGDEYPVLHLTAGALEVLKGDREVRLIEVKTKKGKAPRVRAILTDVEQELFEVLRSLRRTIAQERAVPPFVIFSDATLADMATVRPSTLAGMLGISGIGRVKHDSFGRAFFDAIDAFCEERSLSRNNERPSPGADDGAPASASVSDAKVRAAELFEQGQSIERVAEAIGRATSTTAQYLAEWIESARPVEVSAWVDEATYRDVIRAWQECDAEGNSERLRPVYEKLSERVPYEQIRFVVAHCRATQGA